MCWGSVFVFVLVNITLCPFWVFNHLGEDEKAICFAFPVLRMSCYCKWFVALPYVVVEWTLVCDCGIF